MNNKEREEIVSTFLTSLERLGPLLREGSETPEELTEEKKKCAAYALNLCTVSVSQIIDYEDLNVLEQEYEAILNNLNLENIPKDEPLLQILRQILDVITFFRIQEGDKALVEKTYQQKLKNAIWNAVPNFGLIVAGGNPITMAISLASQIGIGYMNYRRSKAEASLEQERELWHLQRTAIEQFNGLRRELFDTAWRLADKYKFRDEYRLTERQIAQYNRILMDANELRKYERLEVIQDKFQAYPPFWYFFGSAANYIAENVPGLSESDREEKRKEALNHFQKFESFYQYSLLREDQLAASCALEHAGILLKTDPSSPEIPEKLKLAEKMCGNSFDVLELCAMGWLQCGVKGQDRSQYEENAARLLKILVNEDYNRIINAQLLSSIYVRYKNRIAYALLASRVPQEYLYPMPPEGSDNSIEALEKQFGMSQRKAFKEKCALALINLRRKYETEWNRVICTFDLGTQYPEADFYDTPEAIRIRANRALSVFQNNNRREQYLHWLSESNYELSLLSVLNRYADALLSFKLIQNEKTKELAETAIRDELLSYRDKLNLLQSALSAGGWTHEQFSEAHSIRLFALVEEAEKLCQEHICTRIDRANINDLAYMETELLSFCQENNLPEPVVASKELPQSMNGEESEERFTPYLFGVEAVRSRQYEDYLTELSKLAKDQMDTVRIPGKNLRMLYRGEADFNGYFRDEAFKRLPELASHAILVIQAPVPESVDLVFTDKGLVDVSTKRKRVYHKTPYDEVKLSGTAIQLYQRRYENDGISMPALHALILKLNEQRPQYRIATLHTEGVNMLHYKFLWDWFQEQRKGVPTTTKGVVAYPAPGILPGLDLPSVPNDKCLIQYLLNEKDEVLAWRVVKYENLADNLEKSLRDRAGMLVIGDKN